MGKVNRKGGLAGLVAVLYLQAVRAAADSARANVCRSWNKTASAGGHFYLEMIPFRKDFHSQKIGSLATGIKVKG